LGVHVDRGLDVKRSAIPRVHAVVRRCGRGRRLEGERGVPARIERGIVELSATGFLRGGDALKLPVGLLPKGYRGSGRRERESTSGEKSLGSPRDDWLGGQLAVQPLLSADRATCVEGKTAVVAWLEKVCSQRPHRCAPLAVIRATYAYG
jgi:hypothetical protein